MMKFRTRLTHALVGAMLLAPAAASAQRAVPSSLAPSSTVVTSLVAAPALSRAVADSVATPAAAERTDAARVAPRDHADVGPNVGLMIIGGAGIITGAVVGGKSGAVISVAGAVVGLYGLYRYLR